MSEIGEVKLNVEVKVNVTEDTNKVRVAVQKIFGNLNLQEVKSKDESSLAGSAEGLEALDAFHDLLRKERILDAARRMFFSGVKGKTITFFLNKQAAYVGHISFSQPVGESPLGPIRVDIQCNNPKGLIDWLSPKTRQ
ncbi:hypothetical protein KEJ18_03000 [Candidatus Bathyarchaeota archaeon]|nr:hypothetical protein [Candidatus Bathyarchaeota archaeon]